MAEHVLTLKAKLDTNDVQSQMQQLNKGTASNVSNNSNAAASGVSKLSDSLKELKNAIGGGVLVKSFTDLAKSAQLFGQNTTKYVDLINHSMGNLMGALATGNPIIVAFTASMIALNAAFKESEKNLAAAAKAENRRLKYEDAVQSRAERIQQDNLNNLLRSGNESGLTYRLRDLYKQRSEWESRSQNATSAEAIESAEKGLRNVNAEISRVESALPRAIQKTIDGLTKSGDRGSLSQMIEVLQSGQFTYGDRIFDMSVIEQLQDAIEKIDEKEIQLREKAAKELEDKIKKEKEISDKLEEARQNYAVSQKDLVAERTNDISYFQGVLEKGRARMQSATTADEFNQGATREAYAKNQIENIQRTMIENAWKNLTTSPTSNFSALGFSMGETLSPISDIERQIDQIIRLMENQMKQSVQYVNPQYTL